MRFRLVGARGWAWKVAIPVACLAAAGQLAFAGTASARTIAPVKQPASSLHNLLDAYDYCREHRITVYGGGQFELGPGRGQIQYLASLFSFDAPNDVAPGRFNDPAPPPGLPRSPLAPTPAKTGFRWEPDGLPAGARGHSV